MPIYHTFRALAKIITSVAGHCKVSLLYHHWSTGCRKVLTAEDGGTSVADNRIDSSTSSTTPVKAMDFVQFLLEAIKHFGINDLKSYSRPSSSKA